YSILTSYLLSLCFFFFFNATATTEIYTLSLHDALPIYVRVAVGCLPGLVLHRQGPDPRGAHPRLRDGGRAHAQGARARGGGTLERLRDRRDLRPLGTLHLGGELLLPIPQAGRSHPHPRRRLRSRPGRPAPRRISRGRSRAVGVGGRSRARHVRDGGGRGGFPRRLDRDDTDHREVR